MSALNDREVLLERRQEIQLEDTLWDKLSFAQKFAASSLTQFGYDLAFIRSHRKGSVAVLFCDENTATIAEDGEIDTSPAITVR